MNFFWKFVTGFWTKFNIYNNRLCRLGIPTNVVSITILFIPWLVHIIMRSKRRNHLNTIPYRIFGIFNFNNCRSYNTSQMFYGIWPKHPRIFYTLRFKISIFSFKNVQSKYFKNDIPISYENVNVSNMMPFTCVTTPCGTYGKVPYV